jgi:DNA replication and repair protein RecF
LLNTAAPRSFRNLADVPFAPGAGTHLLLGANGAGKTSLLEAIYLAATTKSFRSADLAACARHGEPGFHVALEAGMAGRDRLEIGWQRGQRLRLANGRETPLAEHVALQPVVLWTAAEADLLTGAPVLGRRLIDRGLVSTRPTTLSVLARYRRVLAQKRQLLSSGRDDGLESWNELLAEAAAEVITLRAAYLDALGSALDGVRARTPLTAPALRLAYEPSPRAGTEGRRAILDALTRIAPRERERGAPLLGPHRDALRLLWDGREVGTVASAGEGKVLGLLLAAAQGSLVEATGRTPIYLLDDADAELDRERLTAVWQAFTGVAQLFATSSRPEVWDALPASRRWRLGRGHVSPA